MANTYSLDGRSLTLDSARKCRRILANVRSVLAIEFLSAAQALDFQQLRPGKGVAAARDVLCGKVPHLARDPHLSRYIGTAVDLLRDGELPESVRRRAGTLEAF